MPEVAISRCGLVELYQARCRAVKMVVTSSSPLIGLVHSAIPGNRDKLVVMGACTLM